MPTPVLETIVAHVASAIAGISTVAELTVARNRDEPVKKFPAAIVHDGDVETDESLNTDRADHKLDLAVEFWVEADSGEALGAARHVLYAEIVKAVLTDRTRGGKASDTVETGNSFDLAVKAEGGKSLAHSAVAFRVTFATRQGDPYTVA